MVGTVTEIGMRLRERRKELGMSQAILADRVGTTRQWIGYLERGKRTSEVGMVLDTLRALGLVVDVRARSPSSRGAKAIETVLARLAVGSESPGSRGANGPEVPSHDPEP